MTGQLYGLMAEFESPEELEAATQRTVDAGYRKVEAYSPMPIEGLAEKLGFDTNIQYLVLVGGVAGLILGFGLQYYAAVISYPWIIGGRPFNSFPAFIIIIFELTILLASFAAVFGMIGLNGLPQPYHPVFNAPGFERASQDRFFLCIERIDGKFNVEKTTQFLENLDPINVTEVET
ncbi:MAG TPA: DUF3341 domain-containing protein [Chloroflexi bacterium]|nr:DUF3341 domain-containing protein [Chloroflexota bacterium]